MCYLVVVVVVVVVVDAAAAAAVLALTHRYNAVRGHLTGYNNSGVEDYLRRKINNYSLRVTSLRYYRHTHHCKGSHLLLCIYTYFVWLYRTYMMQGLKLGGEILRWRIFFVRIPLSAPYT